MRGETNLKFLVDRNCHIWDGYCYQAYLKQWKENSFGFTPNEYFSPSEHEATPFTQEQFINKVKTDDEFAKKWGELGPIYGKQWRDWNSSEAEFEGLGGIDQIANVINLLKTDPDSRRMVVNAWNVGELDQMVLPPCHMMFQFYTRELSWYDDLDKIKEIYVDWSLSKHCGGYAGDIKAKIIESANRIFVDGWQKYKDPFTGKLLIELECFSSIPKRAISLRWDQRSNDIVTGKQIGRAHV